VDGSQVGVLKERNKVGLSSLLKSHNSGGLEAQVGLVKGVVLATEIPSHTILAHTLKSCAISRTSLWKGSFLIKSSVDFWYLLISRRATVPGRKRWGFFTPPVAACGRKK
jgi:hypothetical protein